MSNHNCKQIEELIIKQKIEILNENEMNQIEIHLANCSSCNNLYLTVSKLERSMVLNSNDSLKPATEIRDNLITKLEYKSAARQPWYPNIIEIIRSVFTYRIPVYQAGLVGIIIIFLVFYGLNFNRSLPDNKNEKSIASQNIDYSPSNEYMFETHPDINKQKVGVNVREDSSLIGFIYTSM